MEIKTYKNNSLAVPFTIKLNTNGTKAPIDLTTYDVRLIVKEKLTDADNLAIFDKTNTIHSDAVNGQTTFLFTADELNITSKDYKFELKLIKKDLTLELTIDQDVFKVTESLFKS